MRAPAYHGAKAGRAAPPHPYTGGVGSRVLRTLLFALLLAFLVGLAVGTAMRRRMEAPTRYIGHGDAPSRYAGRGAGPEGTQTSSRCRSSAWCFTTTSASGRPLASS